jgi:hypothetical protein
MSVEQAAKHTAPEWQLFTAVARGAAHARAGLPLQDASGYADVSGRLVLAVADGHGSSRHFRSARGSQLAVEAGLGSAGELGARLAASGGAAQLRAAAQDELVPAVTGRWRLAVQHDLSEHPLASRERLSCVPGDDATVPYGSTLLLALLADPWLVLCQIGDGDMVAVYPDGTADRPAPPDPRLDGQYTTSLCQPDAASAFRVAVIDLGRRPVAALLLATDGFGNAQTAEPWDQLFGTDLLRLTRAHGTDWVGAQFPAWVARCASADGSGDDAAAALLVRAGMRGGDPGHRAATREPPA